MLSLLPERGNLYGAPVVCPFIPAPPGDLVDQLYSRFGNNNFAIHSHLTTIGHGVFPVPSRLFNHSCVPNVAAKYTFCTTEAQNVVMEIIALRDILPDEEAGLHFFRVSCFCSVFF
jgi:SET domain